MPEKETAERNPGLVYLPKNRLLRFVHLARLNVRVDREFHRMQARTRPAWKAIVGCVRIAWKDSAP